MSYLFYATYPPCPILSHFAWPPQPPLKSDIIYVRSLRKKVDAIWKKKSFIRPRFKIAVKKPPLCVTEAEAAAAVGGAA